MTAELWRRWLMATLKGLLILVEGGEAQRKNQHMPINISAKTIIKCERINKLLVFFLAALSDAGLLCLWPLVATLCRSPRSAYLAGGDIKGVFLGSWRFMRKFSVFWIRALARWERVLKCSAVPAFHIRFRFFSPHYSRLFVLIAILRRQAFVGDQSTHELP